MTRRDHSSCAICIKYKDGVYYVPKLNLILEKDWWSFIGYEKTPQWLRRRTETEINDHRIIYIGEL